VPLSLVADAAFDWGSDAPLRRDFADTVIYEVHVKGFTMRHPGVPEELRGTYAGLAHDSVRSYLCDLGVTAVELLPVHQYVPDEFLLRRGLTNYWGYNTIGYSAPHAAYSAAVRAGDRAGGQVNEFRAMVRAMHQAGLEVILDVVVNHTAEGGEGGPSLSFRGLDNTAYYRLSPGRPDQYYDTTGTGNSLNAGNPVALRLIMDSLRYWLTEMHVDGFRFDLATQGGNNNAYCQDNEISWVDWSAVDTGLLSFTRELIALRRAHPVFRRHRYLTGLDAAELGWFTPAGTPMSQADWADGSALALGVYLDGSDAPDTGPDGQPLLDDDFLVLVNGWWEPLEFTIGDCRPGLAWRAEIDTFGPAAVAAAPGLVRRAGDRVTVGPRSVLVLRGPRMDEGRGPTAQREPR
jgi:pullulanase/glycogen debranching enzyme